MVTAGGLVFFTGGADHLFALDKTTGEELRAYPPGASSCANPMTCESPKGVLSLADDASAQVASTLCGQVAKMKASYSLSEHLPRRTVAAHRLARQRDGQPRREQDLKPDFLPRDRPYWRARENGDL